MKITATENSYHFEIDTWSFSQTVLFDALNFSLPRNKWTGLLGRSGCGKSTLLRDMAGLLRPSAHLSTTTLTYMAQQDGLLPWASVLENVVLPQKFLPKPDRERAYHYLAEMGLAEFAFAKPQTLSMGMRQRVALARTLMVDADIILLDEPFSALDCFTRHEMHKLSQKALYKKTVFLVTHDPHEAAQLCDGIYLMKNRQLTEYHLSQNIDSRVEMVIGELNAA